MNKIAEHLYRLGDADHPCFLVQGVKKTVLVDAGPAFMAPTYRDELQQRMGGRGPDWLFLTHFHYDHIGGAPYLVRHFPAMKTAGSEKLGRLLTRGKIAAGVTEFNRKLMVEHLPENDFVADDFDYRSLSVHRSLDDGERIDLGGGVAIEVLAAPGHTPDNLSFYLPHNGAVLTAEAVGIIPGNEFWVAPQFLSSYENYLETVDRIRKRRPKLIVLGHHRVVGGQDIDRFFEAALSDCRQFRNMVSQLLQEEQMKEEKVVRRVHKQQVRTGRRGGQPEEAFRLNLQVQVKVIARLMRNEE